MGEKVDVAVFENVILEMDTEFPTIMYVQYINF